MVMQPTNDSQVAMVAKEVSSRLKEVRSALTKTLGIDVRN